MSPVRLLVLGVLDMRGQAHGYAVHRELAAWHADTWTDVKPGSIYHALKQLLKERKIKPASDQESALGPSRTLYKPTRTGHAELLALVEEALRSLDVMQLSAGVAFMHVLPRAVVVALLKEQRRQGTLARNGLDQMTPQFPDRAAAPHTQELLALWSGNLSATLTWMDTLIHRLEAGEFVMAGESSA